MVSVFLCTFNSIIFQKTDPTEEQTCELVDARDNLLAICFENRYEFGTLRRAKYSTLHLLFLLHTTTKMLHLCNSHSIETSAENHPPLIDLLNCLVHASNCNQPHCLISLCQQMAEVVGHVRACHYGSECNTCDRYLKLCFHHSKHCQCEHCFVPLCEEIKRKMALDALAKR